MNRRGFGAIVTIAGVSLLVGLWVVITQLPRWLGTAATAPAAGTAAPESTETRKIHATLFYVSDDGAELVPLSREVPYASTPGEQARRIAEAQLMPAPEGLVSPIPAGTTIRALYITPKGEAFIDLSPEVVKGHTGGSVDEILTVYAIVNALTVNMADLTSVQILVDGKQVDTLAGHVDLRHPLNRSLKWIQKSQQ